MFDFGTTNDTLLSVWMLLKHFPHFQLFAAQIQMVRCITVHIRLPAPCVQFYE